MRRDMKVMPIVKRVGHGGHVIDDVPGAEELAARQESVTMARDVVGMPAVPVATSTPFDYLFDELAMKPEARLPATDPAGMTMALKALGTAMVEAQGPPDESLNSIVTPIYTYWGQFVDHDLTLNTDSNTPATSNILVDPLVPREPSEIRVNLRNGRQPALNLDSVYGDGPTFPGGPTTSSAGFYDGIKLRVGTAATVQKDGTPVPGVRIPPDDDLERDLPRTNLLADIGDARNDENLIIAQLHLAFLRFHNAAVDWVKEQSPNLDDEAVFNRAKQLVQWHYQWLTVHDFLRTLSAPGVVDQILLGGNKHYAPRYGEVYMPLEFSAAAFRFGHSMVRGAYDFNRNFGSPEGDPPNMPLIPRAPFDLLFTFTGGGGMAGQTDVLPFNWIIEWDRMVDKGSPNSNLFARKIDTHVASPLADLLKEGNDPTISQMVKELLKHLAQRNLLRGYLLAMPTGQAVAEELGVAPLTESELRQGNSPELDQALDNGGFITRTPLWYYVLKEAEVRGNGNFLGPVGSHIIGETIIGQLQADPDSYVNQLNGWTPAQGVKFDNGDLVVTMSDMLRFAGVM